MPAPRKIFNNRTLDRIERTIQNLTLDVSINTAVKYREFKEGSLSTFDPETQTITSSTVYKDHLNLEALRGAFSDKEVLLSGGMLELGDVSFLVHRSRLTVTPKRNKDIIVEGGVSYNVKNVWDDPFGWSYVFQCRRV